MRIRPALPAPLLLLLLLASTSLADRQLNPRDAIVDGAADLEPRGPTELPIDGKDGKPHAGPFVGKDSTTLLEQDNLPSGHDHEHKDPDGKPIPPPNDGVMDDPNRPDPPKEGTRGTEGGVSEKSKIAENSGGKTPDAPKEAPPLPHSEEQKITGSDGKRDKEDNKEDKMLEVSAVHSQLSDADSH
jgi:hypothetical protein